MKFAAVILGSAAVVAYTWDQIIMPQLYSVSPTNYILGPIAQAAPCLLCWTGVHDIYILIGGIALLVLAIFVL